MPTTWVTYARLRCRPSILSSVTIEEAIEYPRHGPRWVTQGPEGGRDLIAELEFVAIDHVAQPDDHGGVSRDEEIALEEQRVAVNPPLEQVHQGCHASRNRRIRATGLPLDDSERDRLVPHGQLKAVGQVGRQDMDGRALEACQVRQQPRVSAP